MQVSGGSVAIFANFLSCILTFELKSSSSAVMFPFSGYFCTIGFDVYETAYLWNAQQYLFKLTT